jgi:hypothetical protein
MITGCFLLILYAAGGTTADDDTHSDAVTDDSPPPSNISPSDADSLRTVITTLKEEARRLRTEAHRIYDSLDAAEDTPREPSGRGIHREEKFDTNPIPEHSSGPKDTVELLSRETARSFLDKIKGKKRGGRERGYGGGIGVTPSVFAINIDPVQELLDYMGRNSDFGNADFPIHGMFKTFFMMGLTGYGAVGNGIRIGGSFVGGERSFTARSNDSIYGLKIETSFGGLLLEKAIVHNNCNFYAGGIAGGAWIEVQPSKTLDYLSAAPVEVDESSFNTLSAPGVLLELHGGGTYTMINWCHIGVDFSLPLFFSASGFRTPVGHSVTNGFITPNPGLRFRIIFGNIG